MIRHAKGLFLILSNIAVFLYSQMSLRWPANGHEWMLLFLLGLATLGTGAGLYRTIPPPTPANENSSSKPALGG